MLKSQSQAVFKKRPSQEKRQQFARPQTAVQQPSRNAHVDFDTASSQQGSALTFQQKPVRPQTALESRSNKNGNSISSVNLGSEKLSYPSAVTSPELAELYSQRKDQMQKHMDKLLGDNEAYFKLVRGGLVCGKCFRPKDDLSLDFKKGAQSLYQKDYQKHECSAKVPKSGYKQNEAFDSKQPMDLQTIHRKDYVKHPIEANPSLKEKGVTQFLPFAGTSNYGEQYPNWGGNPTSLVKPPYHPTVIKDMPFMGRSHYNDEYQKKPLGQDHDREIIIQANRRGQFKSPINSDFPFLSLTTYGTTFIPQSISTRHLQQPRKAEAPLPQFTNQYLTTNKKDYTDKSKECHCNDKNCIICGRKMLR